MGVNGLYNGGAIQNGSYHNFNVGDISIDYQYYKANSQTSGVISVAKGANTRVIKVNGDLEIKHNICVGEGTCSSGSGTELTMSARNSGELTNSAELPQVIIFANNIKISKDVDQIDAWLVASGEVDTCSDVSRSNLAKDCAKTLMFNGAVYADKLTLNRTHYGAGSENFGSSLATADLNSTLGASTPAEIFNLRPDVYMWAFEQASRYTQANTVYTEELAPRL